MKRVYSGFGTCPLERAEFLVVFVYTHDIKNKEVSEKSVRRSMLASTHNKSCSFSEIIMNKRNMKGHLLILQRDDIHHSKV